MNNSTLKFALHPDYVVSKTDGSVHYIDSEQLSRLYQLNKSEYIIIDDNQSRREYAKLMKKAEMDKLIHLYPRFKGDYLEHKFEVLS